MTTCASPAFAMACAVPVVWMIDCAWGEPRNAWHPVAWFGQLMRPVGRALREQKSSLESVGGAAAWLFACAAVGCLATFAQGPTRRATHRCPWSL